MPDYNLPVADLPNVMLVVYQKAGMTQDHLSDIQQLLRIESEAIAQTATRLDEDQVRQVVELLANCKGKVVILGVGKSGIIGQKMADLFFANVAAVDGKNPILPMRTWFCFGISRSWKSCGSTELK